jgi:L-asparaginase II
MPGRFASDAFEPVAITSRSGFDESVHFGAAVAVDETGEIVWSIGQPTVEVYPRSACKPMQAEAMLRCGLSLTSEQLALACASHDGTQRQVEIVRSTLAAAGLDETALGNTADLPLDTASAEAILKAGGARRPILMNCSGKHAAMVVTCVANGWPIHGYLAPDHPLQLAITERITELTGRVAHIGVDGCGAPAHVVTLDGLARAFGELAHARGGVWSAMTGHPELVGGERRDVTRLMRAVPHLMAKGGAEGMFAAAVPGGPAAAVKISDGAHRASGVVLAAALREAGVDVDPAQLGEPIRGHGKPVGTCRPLIGSRE